MRSTRIPLVSVILLFALPGPPALAQQRQVPGSRPEVQLSFAPVAAKALPAVVNIYASRAVSQRRGGVFDDPFFRQFFGDRQLPTERVQRSLGSGVIVAADGLVVTNNHVIEDMTEVRVALADRREFEADILLKDARSDLAVLRLKAPGVRFPVLEFADSDKLLIGDLVLAIGNPFGVGQTVTSGIVSAVARSQAGVTDYQSFIQTDAAINPGNSGGALVDLDGRLAGVNTAIFSRSGGSIGIGFAIPANMVKVVVASALSGSSVVRRPWIGARLQSVTADLVEGLGLERPAGVLVADITKDSAAERSGLRSGDVILAVDGQPIDALEDFAYRLATRQIGTSLDLAVVRGNERVATRLKLEPAPEIPPRDAMTVAGRSPITGARIGNLSPAVAEELSIPDSTSGVVVLEVEEGSAAEETGVRRGDIILAVNKIEARSAQELAGLLTQRPRYWQIVIRRGNDVLTTAGPG